MNRNEPFKKYYLFWYNFVKQQKLFASQQQLPEFRIFKLIIVLQQYQCIMHLTTHWNEEIMDCHWIVNLFV